IWVDGEFVPWDDATVHFLSHSLQYGTGVFEGIRAYKTPEGTAVFRLHDHMVRLVASARAYDIPMKESAEEMDDVCLELLRVNQLESAYIRPFVFYGSGAFGINPKSSPVHNYMAAFYLGSYLGDDGVEKGITTMVSSWRRISHTSFIPTAKGSGQYLNSVLAKQEALRAGYDEAIMLNDAGLVSEGSGMNLFIASKDMVYTPPVSSGILEGITRNTVIELLRGEGVEVVEADLARGSLYTADEVFLTGTAAEVTPIREIDGRVVGAGEPGTVTRKAQDLFSDLVAAKIPEYRHWLSFT
ncbi:MAG: branched-chain-amino-acid transaminase, partial [Acidimicrobiia bacterium]